MKNIARLFGTVAFSVAAVAGCSSSQPIAATGDGGPDPQREPGGSSSCDNVVARPLHSAISFGDDVRATALDGTTLFLLREGTAERIVSRVVGDRIEDVAKAPSETALDLSGAGLVVSADAVFFDAIQNGKKSIFRAPRAGGGAAIATAEFPDSAVLIMPSFVADEQFLYFRGMEQYTELARVGKAPSAQPETLGADLFYPYGYQSVVESGAYVYSIQGYMSDGEYSIGRAKKTPGSLDAPNEVQTIKYKLGNCSSAPGRVSLVNGTFYVPCSEDSGNVNKVFRLPDAPWNGEATVPAVEVLTGADTPYDTAVVAGANIYVANTAEAGIMRHPATGATGAGTKVMKSYGVRHVMSDGTSLWVVSSCGIQKIAL